MNNEKIKIRFLEFIKNRWQYLNADFGDYKIIPKKSGVYILVVSDIYKNRYEILYIGSCINLTNRIKSTHPVIKKIQSLSGSNALNCIVFYKIIDKGFFDFERKLIRRMLPKYNKLFYKNEHELHIQ